MAKNRLNTDQRMQVLARLARGDTQAEIQQFLKDEHSIEISAPAISQIKSKHALTVKQMQDTMMTHRTAEAADIVVRSRQSLARKMDRSERDELTLAEARKKYREGEIEAWELERLENTSQELSVRELISLSKEMHNQALKAGDDPSEGSSHDPNMVNKITEAIKAGDTVTLQQIVFERPDKENAESTVEI